MVSDKQRLFAAEAYYSIICFFIFFYNFAFHYAAWTFSSQTCMFQILEESEIETGA